MLTVSFLRALCHAKNDGMSVETRTTALQSLKEEYGIGFRIYPEDNLVLLDYSQIDSQKTNPMVIECRSLILRFSDFAVVSRKFDRFFNVGEATEYYHDFDLSRSIVQEKADGSLVGIYHNSHTNKWEISTRGMAMAEGQHHMGGTFRSRILTALGFDRETPFQTELQFQLACDDLMVPGLTYVMEYISPYNRHVTRYIVSECVLLGIINAEGKVEEQAHLELYERFNIRLPKVYPVKGALEDLVKYANSLTNLEEGFVVFDPISNKRMKIKAADYLFAHRLKGNDQTPTPKNVYTMIFERDPSEFLTYFPEYIDIISAAQERVHNFKLNLLDAWRNFEEIKDQKEFALNVKNIPGSQFLFMAKKNSSNPCAEFDLALTNTKLKYFVD